MEEKRFEDLYLLYSLFKWFEGLITIINMLKASLYIIAKKEMFIYT